MKALTINPHYAALIWSGAKRIEGRTWGVPYRGPLAIHASAGWGHGGFKRAEAWLLSSDCPPEMWNALLDAPGLEGRPLVEGPRRDPWRRPPRWRFEMDGVVHKTAFPAGQILAVCDLNTIRLVNTLERDVYDREEPLCDFDYATHAWVLDNVRPLDPPVACTGSQGLWNVPADVVDQLLAVSR